MSDVLPTDEMLKLARFQILDIRNGSENAKDRLLGRMADEIERLRRDLEIQTVNATAVLQAQHERDVAIEKIGQLRAFILQGREALGSFEARQNDAWLAELDAAIGADDVPTSLESDAPMHTLCVKCGYMKPNCKCVSGTRG